MLSLRIGRQFYLAAFEGLRVCYTLTLKVRMRKVSEVANLLKGFLLHLLFLLTCGDQRDSTVKSEVRPGVCFGSKYAMNLKVI